MRVYFEPKEGFAIESLVDKIKMLTSMTKTEKIIADYLLDNLDTVGLQTITELAQNVGVSDTSVIRLLRNLGFSGYSDFKREMNARMVKQYSEALSPGEKHRKTRDKLNKNNLAADVMNRAIDNIHKSCGNIDIKSIDEAAQWLLDGNRKFIAGFRGTACCTVYMSRKLCLLMPNVTCCDTADSVAVEQIVDIGPDDSLLLYSFPRYTELCKGLLEIARKRGAKTILITDKYTSPLAPLADLVIAAAVDGLGFTNSYLAPMLISEIILLTIGAKIDINSDFRAALLDEYMNQYKLY